MMARGIFFSLIILLISASVGADEARFDGTWHGRLKVGAVSLPVIFNLDTANGVGTMDSPDQGARGIPVSDVKVKDTRISFRVPSASGSYEGTITADGISGTWRQGGRAFELNLVRADVESGPAALAPEEPKRERPQRIKDFSSYIVEDVTFMSNDDATRLAATLTRPSRVGQHPAIILVTGSGPQDRDETIAGHKPFELLADYFTRAGFLVLRYDDRGVGQSKGDFDTATTFDFAEDTIGAVRYLRGRADVQKDRVGLLGHSEGGIVAPIAMDRCACLDFAILLAAPTVPYPIFVVEQVRALASASGADAEAVSRAVRAQQKIIDAALKATSRTDLVERVESVMVQEGAGVQQARQAASQFDSEWIYQFLHLDPAAYLPSMRSIPVLALYGSKDLQVDAAMNAAALKAALKDAPVLDVAVIEGVNHLFQTTDTGLVSEYAVISETMSPRAIGHMLDWLKDFGARSK